MPQTLKLCSLKSASNLAAARGAGEATHSRRALWARQCCQPEAQETLGPGRGASRLPAPRTMLAVSAAGSAWRILGSLKNAILNDNDLILYWFNES